MHTQCQAQALPSLIVQRIAEFLPNDKETMHHSNGELAVKKPWLLPLLRVCRRWNKAISSIFYRSAMVMNDGLKVSYNNYRSILTLDDVVTMDKLPYLRELQFYVVSTDFISAGDNPAAQMERILSTYGPLIDVNGISLYLAHNKHISNSWVQLESDSDNNAFIMGAFESELLEFVDCLCRLLPNRRMLNIFNIFYPQQSALSQSATQKITDTLPKLLGPNISHFFASFLGMAKSFVASLQGSTLRHITFVGEKEPQQYAELIRQNRFSLEYLMLQHINSDLVAKIAESANGDTSLVYPSLKELRMISCPGFNEPDEKLFSVNPFPALDTFICQDSKTLIVINILRLIRPTVRVLKLDIDHEVAQLLNTHCILAAGSFKRLEIVSMKELAHVMPMVSSSSSELFINFLNLSPVAHTVQYGIFDTVVYSDDIFSNIVFSNNLRSLDIGCSYLTINQAVQVLVGFKRLYKIILSLQEETLSPTRKLPTIGEIQQFKARFKGCLSSVRIISIATIGRFSPHRAGEYIVLMTSVLSSIRQVGINKEHIPDSLLIEDSINRALKRHVYKGNDHLQNVVYSIKFF